LSSASKNLLQTKQTTCVKLQEEFGGGIGFAGDKVDGGGGLRRRRNRRSTATCGAPSLSL